MGRPGHGLRIPRDAAQKANGHVEAAPESALTWFSGDCCTSLKKQLLVQMPEMCFMTLRLAGPALSGG
jgi:hypothetical protein